MAFNQYPYRASEDEMTYEFYSEGPKGRIRKVVEYELMSSEGIGFYNLGFGDSQNEGEGIDDFIISANLDTEKVLMTVGRTVINFILRYPDAVVFIRGSTISRTRLYQMGINKYWNKIEPLFEVFGEEEPGKYQKFSKGINYTSFLVMRKKI